MYRSHPLKLPRPKSRMAGLILASWLTLTGCLSAAWALDIPLTVKENAEIGVASYPVSVVIPLPKGRFADPRALGLRDRPSQVEVLERWPGDRSLRHVLAHFQTEIGPHQDKAFHFVNKPSIAPARPIGVEETSDGVTVSTGPLRFRISKIGFNLLDQVWLDRDRNGTFEDTEQMLVAHEENGGVFTPRAGAGPVQVDSARTDLNVTVEERGPMRAVIRVEAPAKFTSTSNHLHGFAVRFYAYAGQPFIKIDYQLQNSAKNVVRSWPLYFESMTLDLRLSLGASPTVAFGLGEGETLRIPRGEGATLAQEMHNRFRIYDKQDGTVIHDSGTMTDGAGPEGFIDVNGSRHGVMAAIRNFWQTCPN